MDFTPTRKPASSETFVKFDESSHTHDLQLYREIPDININLDEFEEWTIERLKVLQILEQLGMKGSSNSYEDFTKSVVQEIKKEGLRQMYKLVTGGHYTDHNEKNEAIIRDVCSHFILRLVYCKSDELRKWFINREVELFKLRWSFLSQNDILKFLSINDTNYSAVDAQELKFVTENNISTSTIGKNDYFKVRWTQVLDLVRNKKIIVHNGFAYVVQTDVISGVCQTFRSELSQELTKCFQKFSAICEDERFSAFVKYLNETYIGKNFSVSENLSTLSINNIDLVSKDYFPLCMKKLHNILRSEHHLKHQARQQYGLFLKGAGLSLDQALVFWRSEFTKKMDADKFDKQYAYNIRHNYGKEGKKTNYTPYSCLKIIMGAVSLDECHGCPYKHMNRQSLKLLLESSDISAGSITEVLNLCQTGHYQIACTKFFIAKYGESPTSPINHPNQFFQESQNLKDIKPMSRFAELDNSIDSIASNFNDSIVDNTNNATLVDTNNISTVHTSDRQLASMDESCES